MTASEQRPYILGLDVGANSVGWAVLEAGELPEGAIQVVSEGPVLRAAGVRIFEAGVDGDIDSGKEESRNLKRRTMRGSRKRLDRVRRRLSHTYSLLEAAGLIPPTPAGLRDQARTDARDAAMKAQEREILKRWSERLKSEGADANALLALAHTWPYLLRSRGLDERLELHEFGRALYHIAQRRGFKSNRKDVAKSADEEKEQGVVKTKIASLKQSMSETHSRTYGEHFAQLTPHLPLSEAIRGRYTAREEYEREFYLLWESQAKYYPEILTDALRDSLHSDKSDKKRPHGIFYQRPFDGPKRKKDGTSSKKRLSASRIGRCSLEPTARRAPFSCPEFQEFRVLQKVNDAVVRLPRGERALTDEERAALLHALEHNLDAHGNLTLARARKALDLKKEEALNFGGDAEEEKTLPGFRTLKKLRDVFTDARWDRLSEEERTQAYLDVASIREEAVLQRCAMTRWNAIFARLGLPRFSEDDAIKFSKIRLEPDYCNLSRKAMRQLLPLMREGTQYATARKAIYGDPEAPPCLDTLPPIRREWKRSGQDYQSPGIALELRNPAVERALTELRKVVNAIVRVHGKPAQIRIEFARELKKSKKQRQETEKLNRENKKSRDKARVRIMSAEVGIQQPTRTDELKALLFEECGGICPYTGDSIAFRELFGAQSPVDIEHIIPYSISLDDSFLNKTLCRAEENRTVKRNRTPWQAYGHDQERFDRIIASVERFKGDHLAKRRKLERFMLEDVSHLTADFTTRQLNDTRYIARLARQFLGQLYGCDVTGIDPVTRKIRILVAQGGITAALRNEWELNDILSKDDHKSRDDHRHHAVDAVVIACTDQGTIQRFAREAQANESKIGRWWKGDFTVPFDGFKAQLKEAIDDIVVSHRVDRRVSGPIHQETLYSPPKKGPDGRDYLHVRKNVYALTSTKDIVDDAVRAAVEARLNEVGGDFKKLEGNWPALITAHGEATPIKTARIRVMAKPLELGEGSRKRQVLSGSNHHMEIVEITDKKGQVKWEGHLVPMAEAYRRLKAGEPVVKIDHGPGKKLVMALTGGDIIEVDDPKGEGRKLYRVRIVTEMMGQMGVRSVALNEARMTKEIPTEAWLRKTPQTLRQIGCEKVEVDPIGNVRKANHGVSN